jgi:translation initiation factor IF-1
VTEVSREARAERGTIEEVLPNQMYRVRLDDGRTLRAGLAPSIRHSVVRLISGSIVLVRVSQHDPNRGQIVEQARRQAP